MNSVLSLLKLIEHSVHLGYQLLQGQMEAQHSTISSSIPSEAITTTCHITFWTKHRARRRS